MAELKLKLNVHDFVKGFIMSPKSAQSVLDQIKEDKSNAAEKTITNGLFNRIHGFEILKCDEMPDDEYLTFKDRDQATTFIKSCKYIGYEKSKKIFMEDEE